MPHLGSARHDQYAMRSKVETELDRLVVEGTLEPVEFADWAASIIVILKSNMSSVRICRAFRQMSNPHSKLDTYPIPKVEDLFATLSGGCVFSKINLSQPAVTVRQRVLAVGDDQHS